MDLTGVLDKSLGCRFEKSVGVRGYIFSSLDLLHDVASLFRGQVFNLLDLYSELLSDSLVQRRFAVISKAGHAQRLADPLPSLRGCCFDR